MRIMTIEIRNFDDVRILVLIFFAKLVQAERKSKIKLA